MNFRPEMVDAIREGRKSQTRRLLSENPRSPWWKEDCAYVRGHVGGYAICPGRSKSAVGRLELTADPVQEALGAMEDGSARAEGFDGFLDFQAYWERLHGKFDPRLKVWVLTFEVIEWH